jgi:hypothetical protein
VKKLIIMAASIGNEKKKWRIGENGIVAVGVSAMAAASVARKPQPVMCQQLMANLAAAYHAAGESLQKASGGISHGEEERRKQWRNAEKENKASSAIGAESGKSEGSV